MQEQITGEMMNKIEAKVKECLRTKIIDVEQFVTIFEERFNERVIGVSYDNGFVSPGITFEEATAIWYNDNNLHFMESENIGEVTYNFSINLNNLDHIRMIDYWLDGIYPETDYGAQFFFVGKDGSKIIINADK